MERFEGTTPRCLSAPQALPLSDDKGLPCPRPRQTRNPPTWVLSLEG